MTVKEKQQLVRRLQAGKRKARANRPERLASIEQAMSEAGDRYKAAKARHDYEAMKQAREQLHELGPKRFKLKWGDCV